MMLCFVIGIGLIFSKIRIKGASLGAIWVLFVGILFGALGVKADALFLHFLKEFGLVLFVFTVGFQVGPGFFSSFRKEGLKFNLMTLMLISLVVITTLVLWNITGKPLPEMVGTMSGAVTNAPGMGTAQQTWYDAAYGTLLAEVDDPDTASAIANNFAIAYPVGLLAAVLAMLLLKAVFRVDLKKEASAIQDTAEQGNAPLSMRFEVVNPAIAGKHLSEILDRFPGKYTVTGVTRGQDSFSVADNPVLAAGDCVSIDLMRSERRMLGICFGKEINEQKSISSRKILVTNTSLSGKKIKDLNLDTEYGISVVRILRSGVELVAIGDMYIQIGDGLRVVGDEEGIRKFADAAGNNSSELDKPNLAPVFIGLGLGLILGAVPLRFPGMSHAIHFGLAAGPLIIGIIIGHFGPRWKFSTYTSTSALRIVREIGLCIFLATVGLGAGSAFPGTFVSGGWNIMLYSALIAFVPMLLTGIFARLVLKQNFYNICGLLSGATTNPFALDFSRQAFGNQAPSIAYSAVYPFALFLQVLSAQLLILLAV